MESELADGARRGRGGSNGHGGLLSDYWWLHPERQLADLPRFRGGRCAGALHDGGARCVGLAADSLMGLAPPTAFGLLGDFWCCEVELESLLQLKKICK